ncbi:hypothetical protein [Paenibacillus piri]|uniref:Uncharacterized protein n=1 Tax=Paenibacillus piri TaxID=2547395 RepID=A0A4R5KJW2_9BACL|nr:hypothetical protein [Paenibacillus piri]TDF95115.1 hypothetical protein E1757_21510 [Paenibacillus piri]
MNHALVTGPGDEIIIPPSVEAITIVMTKNICMDHAIIMRIMLMTIFIITIMIIVGITIICINTTINTVIIKATAMTGMKNIVMDITATTAMSIIMKLRAAGATMRIQ